MTKPKPKTFRESLLAQQAEIRKDFKVLAKIYPSAFDANGRPIVAVAALPGYWSRHDQSH